MKGMWLIFLKAGESAFCKLSMMRMPAAIFDIFTREGPWREKRFPLLNQHLM
jgi:hypothetical protein